VVIVVGLGAKNAGLFDSSKSVSINGSASPSPGASASESGSPSSSAAPTASAPAGGTTSGPAPLAPGLAPAQVGLEFAIASFLIQRYDTAVKPVDRFQQDPGLELLSPSSGPAVWFARDISKFPDALSVASTASSTPCTAYDPARRVQVAEALSRLVAGASTPAQRLLAQIAVGDVAGTLDSTAAPAGDAALPMALARALAGGAAPDVDRLLQTARPAGWALALRAHLAVMTDRRDEALQLLNQVNTAATAAGEVYLAAGLAMRMGDYHLASGLLERIATLSPKDGYPLYWRGLIAEKAGRAEEALGRYQSAFSTCADPKLVVAARVRRALLHQKGGLWEPADADWRAAEDFDPDSYGVLLAKAASVQAGAEHMKGNDRMSALSEALDRWQRLVIVLGPREDIMTKLLACYTELKDQATAREGLQLLNLLADYGFLTDPNVKGRVGQMLDTLKDRVRPRQIWEAPPK